MVSERYLSNLAQTVHHFLFNSIKGKLAVAFFLLIGAALIFQFFYLSPKFQKQKIEQIKTAQQGFARYLADEINARLTIAARELEEMAALAAFADLEKTAMDRTIAAINASNHFFNYFFVMDTEGRWLSYPTRADLVGQTIPKENMGWVQATVESDQTVFLDVVKSKIGTLVSGFSTPIRDRNEKTVALLRGVFVVSENNFLVDAIRRVKTLKDDQAYLVSSNGWLIAHSHKNLNYARFDSYSMIEYEPVRQALAGNDGVVEYAYGGKRWIAAFHPIGVTRWGLVVERSFEAVGMAAEADARRIGVIILGCFLIGLVIAALIVQNALRPLFRLVENIRSGVIGPAADYPRDEIGQLALKYRDLFNDLYESNESLRKSEKKFRTLFNNANDAIFIHDLDGNLLEANQKAVDYIGYSRSELLTMNVTDVDAPESAAMIQSRIDAIKRGERLIFEAVHRTKSGASVPVEASSCMIEYDDAKAILSHARDLIERKKYEEKMNQAQRMEALGTLAGGVAHDFNNLLMGIQGHVSLMAAASGPNDAHAEHLTAIEEYITRAADLTNKLLGLSRGGKFDVRPIDINALIVESASLFGRTKKEIRIRTELSNPTPVVEADRRQIEQVLLNLFVNAWQAMRGGGDIHLAASVVHLDESFCEPHAAAPGAYAKISVRDTGIGMDDETCRRVFDPFFTTKEKDRGTGLGLASAYGIVKNHSGIITVRSQIGQGATFEIYLPLSDKPPVCETPTRSDMLTGHETVLLVDDEEMILEVGQAMLEALGYTVIVAKGGEQAIALFRRKRNDIALVILDLIMPGMDGGATFDRIRDMNPGVPVILSSGYAINGMAETIMQRGCDGFIQKPFSMNALSQKIRKVLEAKTSERENA